MCDWSLDKAIVKLAITGNDSRVEITRASEENWNASEGTKSQFEVSGLLPEQRDAIKSFFQGKNVFVNYPLALESP